MEKKRAMKRSYVIGLVVAAGVAGVAFAGRRWIGVTLGLVPGTPSEPQQVQWPFDRAELRLLMDRVVEAQRAIIGQIERADDRRRAQAFLDYYLGRRAAVPADEA